MCFLPVCGELPLRVFRGLVVCEFGFVVGVWWVLGAVLFARFFVNMGLKTVFLFLMVFLRVFVD